jgi:hypothetical protein
MAVSIGLFTRAYLRLNSRDKHSVLLCDKELLLTAKPK